MLTARWVKALFNLSGKIVASLLNRIQIKRDATNEAVKKNAQNVRIKDDSPPTGNWKEEQ